MNAGDWALFASVAGVLCGVTLLGTLWWRRDKVRQLRREHTAELALLQEQHAQEIKRVRAALDKYIGLAAEAITDRHDAITAEVARTLATIASAGWPTGDPDRPAQPTVAAIIDAITPLTAQRQDQRRAAYAAEHPEYINPPDMRKVHHDNRSE